MSVPRTRAPHHDRGVYRVAFVGLAGCWNAAAVGPTASCHAEPKLSIRVAAAPGGASDPDDAQTCSVIGRRAPELFVPLAVFAIEHLVSQVDLGSEGTLVVRYLPPDGSSQPPPGISISIDPRSELGRVHVEHAWQDHSTWIEYCARVVTRSGRVEIVLE